MRKLTTIDTIWKNVALPASPHWTSQISYEAVASLLRTTTVWTSQIFFVTIPTNYFWSLEAAYSHFDDTRYDVFRFVCTGQSTLDLSDELRRCFAVFMNAILLSIAYILCHYLLCIRQAHIVPLKSAMALIRHFH